MAEIEKSKNWGQRKVSQKVRGADYHLFLEFSRESCLFRYHIH